MRYYGVKHDVITPCCDVGLLGCERKAADDGMGADHHRHVEAKDTEPPYPLNTSRAGQHTVIRIDTGVLTYRRQQFKWPVARQSAASLRNEGAPFASIAR